MALEFKPIQFHATFFMQKWVCHTRKTVPATCPLVCAENVCTYELTNTDQTLGRIQLVKRREPANHT